MKKLSFYTFISVLLLCSTSAIQAQLTTSKLFNDHMVLQRNEEIHVWGWHKKGKKVTVTFNDKTYTAKTNSKGKWLVSIPKMAAGGPYTMTISSGKEQIAVKDILIGDVWVCSGQSNMEWVVQNTNNAEDVIAKAKDAGIRHFKVPLTYASTPQEQLAGGDWQVTSSETVANFTAVGYFFAENLRALNPEVPIGLINTSWGGSRIEPWMSAKALGMDTTIDFDQKAKEAYEEKVAKFNSIFPNLGEVDAGFSDGEARWANPETDVSNWVDINPNKLWEEQGFADVDGYAWYRTNIPLSAEDIKEDAMIYLGPIDDSDYTYFNGKLIGQTLNEYITGRVYTLPKELLKEGDNTLVIRVEDTGGGGGLFGNPQDLYVKTTSKKTPLTNKWVFRLGSIKKGTSNANQEPTLLYNKMVYPILDFPIKGAIWYQGESNTNTPEEAEAYTQLFKGMITQWRSDWGIGEFPFLFVQLANFMAPTADANEDSNWAILRASQSKTLALPNTAQAVIIDIGEAFDIHPRNKKDVGYRLALGAKKIAYGQEIKYAGPTYKSHTTEGNTVTISYDHIGDGLVSKSKYGYVNGFALAGEDGVYHWAKAKIEGNRVKVWSEEVPHPKHIRYAWANNPDDVNLYNKEGLPADPFSVLAE